MNKHQIVLYKIDAPYIFIARTGSLEHPMQKHARLLVEDAINHHQWGSWSDPEEQKFSICCTAVQKLRNNKTLTPEETAAFYQMAFSLQYEREVGAVNFLQTDDSSNVCVRLKKAAQHMGWNTKKEGIDYADLFQEYLDLLIEFAGGKKFNESHKESALSKVSERHEISDGTCFQYLNKYILERRKDGAHIDPVLPQRPG